MNEENGQAPEGTTDERGREKSVGGSDLRALEVVLRRTGRAYRGPMVKEGVLWAGVTALAVVLSGLVVAALFGDAGYGMGRWVMGLGLLLTAVGAGVSYGLFWLRRPTEEEVARLVQRHSPEFRSDLVAALEFGKSLEEDGGKSIAEQGFSVAMARAHLARTTERVLERCEQHSLVHLLPQRTLTGPLLALTGAVVLLVVPFGINAGWTMGVLSGERLGTPVVGERVEQRSMVGYVDAVFVYPSYTGVDRQLMRLGGGYMEAITGTTVHLRVAMMDADYEEVEMVVEVGEEEPEVIRLEEEGLLYAGTIEVEESGHYWFRGTTVEGRPVEDRQERRIRALPDEAPEVRILSHEGRVSVQPEDVITIQYAARDDFGLETVSFVRQFEGSKGDEVRERLEIPELRNQPGELEGEIVLDLQPLNLQPNDGVVIYFEARDVNTATGPGEGRSDAVVLYVESPEDRHLETIGMQQEVMTALLMHLGDFLEAPVGERERQEDQRYRQVVKGEWEEGPRLEAFQRTRQLHGQRTVILEEMAAVIAAMEEDSMMVPRNQTLFEGLYHRLGEVQGEGDRLFDRLGMRAERRDMTMGQVQEVADYAATSEEELERGILSLEELLVQQKMDLVNTTAESIEALRARLKELIEQYRDSEDPELRAAIQREIERLRQRMNELMARMQMQLQQMPQEHVNLEALQEMELESSAREMQDQLKNIEEMLDSGDIDGALAALDAMEMGLDELNQEIGEGFEGMEPEGISALDQAVAEMMDEVTRLEEMERGIEEETRALQEEMREKREEELERMVGPLMREVMERIEAQEAALEEMGGRAMPDRDQVEVDRARDQVEELKEMVEQQDVEQSLERARQVQNGMRSLRSTLSLSERYAGRGEEGDNVRRARRESEGLVERSDEIASKLEEFMNRAGEAMQPQESQQMQALQERQQEARGQMQALRERLAEEGERFPALDQQLRPSMEASEEAMQSAEEALRERRVQDALDQERRAIQQLGELRESMSEALEQERRQQRQQEGRQERQDKVEIPQDQTGENRERLRREMMEGMREGRIGEYESQIERYFRSLVE